MSAIFSEYRHGKFHAKNRIVRSATWLAKGDENGYPTGDTYGLFEKLAKGGAGTVIFEVTYTREPRAELGERFLHRSYRLTEDAAIPYYGKAVDIMKREGCQVIDQQPYPGFLVRNDEGEYVQATPDTLGADDIEQIIRDHADGAVRAKKAGFDGVQVHCASGGLLCHMLSPGSNHRTDGYGRDRTKIVADIFAAIRDAAGDDFQIWVKMSADTFLPESMREMRPAELTAADFCRKCAEIGFDAIEVVEDPEGRNKGAKSFDRAIYEAAYDIKNTSDATVILNGGIKSIDTLEAIADEGNVDVFSLSRALVSEPDLPSRWRGGDRRPSRCVSCNRCYELHRCVFDR